MIKIILKFTFAIGIIVWLFQKGLIDFSIIPQSLDNKLEWLVALSIFMTGAILSAIRWRILLHIKSEKKLPILSVIKVTWIGLFFNTVLPGVVTGDFIKMIYAKDLDSKLPKSFLLTSVFMDRIIGLVGLIFLLGFFSVMYYAKLVSLSSELANLIHFNFLIFGFIILFTLTLFLPDKMQNKILNITEKIPFAGNGMQKIFSQVWLIGKNRMALLVCFVISIFNQALFVFAFWFLASPFFSTPLPLQHAYTFMPLGFMAIAIPISPAGLGVGHAIFGTLFSYFGISGGASLFNLHFLAGVSINLSGAIPYIFFGKRHQLKKAQASLSS